MGSQVIPHAASVVKEIADIINSRVYVGIGEPYKVIDGPLFLTKEFSSIS